MRVINSLSITNFENLVVTTEPNKTRLKINFDVSFNHDGSENANNIYRNLYGFKVQILGYPEPEVRNSEARQVFNFERTVYRWVPDRNRFGGRGYWGDGRIVRTTTETFDLSGEPTLDGQIGISEVTYSNQGTSSQEIELDLLDVNPATPIRLSGPFGNGTFYAREEDKIFARVSIVNKRTGRIVKFEDSNVLRGYFGAVEA